MPHIATMQKPDIPRMLQKPISKAQTVGEEHRSVKKREMNPALGWERSKQ